MTDENVQEGNFCVTVIGTQRREFMPVMRAIATLETPHQLNWYQSLEEALADDRDGIDDADLVIVFQSSPDQFSRKSVETIVGRTIFARLLCCYGPWCESDGRNRDLWPDAVRVPLRLASAVIKKEVDGILHDDPPLPPTAARDELFAHRLGCRENRPAISSQSQQNAVVISPDRVLRNTVKMGLKESGIRTTSMTTITRRPTDPVDPKVSSAGPIHLVIHDLDPWSPLIEESLHAAREMFPSADFFGFATMPDAGLRTEIADEDLQSVIPKLDLESGLRHHLQEWSAARSAGRLHERKTVPA